MLHQDTFAARYDDDEYTLLGMAIKYAGLHCVTISIIGKDEETLTDGNDNWSRRRYLWTGQDREESHRQNVIHGGAVAADQFDARLRANHRQRGHVRRMDRAARTVLGFNAQNLRLVAVDPDIPAAAGVDQDSRAEGRRLSEPSGVGNSRWAGVAGCGCAWTWYEFWKKRVVGGTAMGFPAARHWRDCKEGPWRGDSCPCTRWGGRVI